MGLEGSAGRWLVVWTVGLVVIVAAGALTLVDADRYGAVTVPAVILGFVIATGGGVMRRREAARRR